MKEHPIKRFSAPGSIETGTPLKLLINESLVSLISESYANVFEDFDTRRFQNNASTGLDALELKARAAHIADALAKELPRDPSHTLDIIIHSLGPELDDTQENGLQPFFYLAHAELISRFSETAFEAGMRANYELTKRFTAEFSIRTYITNERDRSLEILDGWIADPNPHVRRLVSEGSRPRLPWAMRLKEIDQNPGLTLPLLEKLKDDSSLYVRRSVANHLGDLAKDNLEIVLETCKRWLDETESMHPEANKNRRWVIRHALRHPAKKENQAALELRLAAK